MDVDALGKWLGWGLMAGYIALTAVEARRYFATALGPASQPAAPVEAPAPWRRVLGEVLAAFAISRLLVALVCAVGKPVSLGCPPLSGHH